MLKICLNHSNNFIAGYKVWIYPHRISMFVASNGYCPMVNLSFNSFNGLHLFRRCPMRHLEGAAKATDGSSHCFAGARSGRRQADGSLLRQEGKTILFAGIFYDLGGEKCLILPCFTRKPKIGGRIVGFNGVSDAINEDTQYNQWRYNGNKHWNSLMCAMDPET